MRRNKWKYFLLDLSFAGWHILSLFTLGMLDLLFVNPYIASCRAELYAVLRRNYVLSRSPGYEALNDSYLEHVPSSDELLISKALYDDSQGPYTRISYFAPGQYPVFLFSVQPPLKAVRSPIRADRKYDLLSCLFLFQVFSMFGWILETLFRLIDICRLVSSKHTRSYVRACLPAGCGYVLDELLHAHFEDHDKDLYYGQIVGSIIENGRADRFITRLCELIKRLAVDKLHIVGDLFDRGPRPDIILDLLLRHHSVDIQWGNHDVVWMGAAAGSPLCCATVMKTTLAYHNHGMLEDSYGINLRHLQRLADHYYGGDDLTIWMPHTDAARGPYTEGMLHRCAVMHKAISIIMFKLECAVIDRNPDFQMEGRDYLRRIDFARGTVDIAGRQYPLRDTSFPTVDPADPAALNPDEQLVLDKLVASFRQSEKLQQHVRFLYAKGSVYHIENGNLLYHGAVPMTEKGAFAAERFEGRLYAGRALMDYCDERARRGYYAPEGSAARQSGQDFLWYLWCGRLSPLFGRSAMTTFERLYIADKAAHAERKNPYYALVSGPGAAAVAERILAEFGLSGEGCHILNGHVPVRAVEGEDPVKAGGRLVVIDGGFCRAYHRRTGIAGYTLIYSSHGIRLKSHRPFEGIAKVLSDNADMESDSVSIEQFPRRRYIADTDEGVTLRRRITALRELLELYRSGELSQF